MCRTKNLHVYLHDSIPTCGLKVAHELCKKNPLREQIISEQVKHAFHRPAGLRFRCRGAWVDQCLPAEWAGHPPIVGHAAPSPGIILLVEDMAAVAQLPHTTVLPQLIQAHRARWIVGLWQAVLDVSKRLQGEILSQYPQISRGRRR